MSPVRTVISGLGVVAPNGIGAAAYWDNTRKGLSGIRKIDRFDASKYATQVAGTVEGFEATDYIDKRLMVQTDNWTWMALAGAKLALEDAAFEPADHPDPDRMSVVTASSSGGNEFGQREIQSLWAKGPRFVGAYQSIAWFYAATTGQLAIKHVMKGHCNVIVSEQAGGLDAVAAARRQISRGEVDVVLSGGTEAPVGPYAIACQQHNGLMAEGDDPDGYRPFSTDAAGYVPGEGGAILLVESLDGARARGTQVYAEVLGHGATQDGINHTAPAADGKHYARAIQIALDDAGVSAADVDLVFADGFGTAQADAAEAAALAGVFGSRASSIPVTAPKSMTGRLYAGGSSLDLATAALAISDGYIPPTTNVGTPAYDLDVVTEGRAQQVDTVLVAARGIGGFNSAMVLRRVAD